MKKFVIGVLILFLFIGCNNKTCEDRLIDVLKLSDSIYYEEYLYYGGGVFGGDIIYSYITDSISFREQVGKYDDNGIIFCRIVADTSIEVYSVTDIGLWKHQYDTVLLQSHDITFLKKKHVFNIPCGK